MLLVQIMLFVQPLEIALEQTQEPASWQIRTLAV
jgi:hypothetical protein